MATKSLAFGSEKPQRAGLSVDGKGGFAGELGDLRKDLQNAFKKLEARTSYPEIQWLDGGAPSVGGGDLVIKGANLLQGQSFATLTLWEGTSSVVITALKPGAPGNDFTIAVAGGGTAGSETVVKTGNAFVVTIEVGVSTANQIATAINDDLNAGVRDADGYLMAVSGGAGTTNAVAAAANLAGGVGEGWACYVSGVEALPANTTGATGAAAVAEAECTVTVPDLSAETDARAAADIAAVVVTTDGVSTRSVDVALGV